MMSRGVGKDPVVIESGVVDNKSRSSTMDEEPTFQYAKVFLTPVYEAPKSKAL